MQTPKAESVEIVFTARSERVKMVDVHPKEPLLACALYSGQVTLWNFETKAMLKSFEVSDSPVRCVRFIPRLQCIACGSDDFNIRIFNFNNMEKVKTFQAHEDYLRCLAVHDQLPVLLSCADDMTIRQWDWSKGWANTMTYEGHTHFVMSIAFNPRDSSSFATGSLDCTVKVWGLSHNTPKFQLEGHEDGVNCVDFYHGADRPYLISGSDDQTVRIWDYQTKACLQVLSHHQNNVVCVHFHPDAPIAFTGSEDETVGIVNTQTWRGEEIKHYMMGRVWSFASRPKTNYIAMGFDRGLLVGRVGKSEPIMSMDSHGKIVIADGNELLRIDVKGLPDNLVDGDIIPLQTKEIASTDTPPQRILHGPGGQFVAVLTKGEYTINSSLSWRAKTGGQGASFAWGPENGTYAVLSTRSSISFFKAFKLQQTITLPEPALELFTGSALGVRTSSSVYFHDWSSTQLVRRIEESPKLIEWSDSGELVALVTEVSLFVLKYAQQAVCEHFAATTAAEPTGLDFAFDLVEEVEEKVRQVVWVGDCMCYVNSADRLNYYIGGEVTTIAVLNKHQFLLGYLPKENRLFCIDRERNVVSYQLFVSVINYKTSIVRGDLEAAAAILPMIPEETRHKVAEFLQSRGLLELAIDITPDDDHRFNLSISLGRLETAIKIAEGNPTPLRWKQIGDTALEQCYLDIAEMAMRKASDVNGLLLLYTSLGDLGGISRLGDEALSYRRANAAFACYHLAGRHEDAAQLLAETGKAPEATFYARTYCPNLIDDMVLEWKNSMASAPRFSESIADPSSFPNLFPSLKLKDVTKIANGDAGFDPEPEKPMDTDLSQLSQESEGSATAPVPPKTISFEATATTAELSGIGPEAPLAVRHHSDLTASTVESSSSVAVPPPAPVAPPPPPFGEGEE